MIIFLSVTGCVDYDEQYWQNYTLAMSEEWNIQTEVYCLEVKQYPKALWQAQMLRTELGHMNQTTLFVSEWNKGTFWMKEAIGVAYSQIDLGFVMKGMDEVNTSTTVSHETLHFWEYQNNCTNTVHMNAHRFVQRHDISILEYFSCNPER